ncbi:hypothetical protein C8R43DRAFT_1231879 [Mycena crocata]|nr:hypothetical protein C8R43DRAFT_1231879 [Mycena crocata]
MPLALSIEELFTLQVEATLNAENGAITFNFRRSPTDVTTLATPTGFRVHFETTVDSNGASILRISATSKDWECGEEPSYGEQGVWPAVSDNRGGLDCQELSDAGVMDTACGMLERIVLPAQAASMDGYYFSERNFMPVLDCIPPTSDFSVAGNVQSACFAYPDNGMDQDERIFCQASYASAWEEPPQVPDEPASMVEYSGSPPAAASPLPDSCTFPPLPYEVGAEPLVPTASDPPERKDYYRPPSPPSTAPSPTPSMPASDDSYVSTKTSEEGKPRVPCLYPDCDRHFKNDYTRSIHMRAHVVKHTRYPCRQCPLVLSRQHDRMRHEVSKHGVVPAFTCTLCSKPFHSEHNLAKHKCIGMDAF